MTSPDNERLVAALRPVTSRVRRDVTAIKNSDGRQAWTREVLNKERLARHLNGGPARGVSQIKAGESVTLIAILDLDSHKGETPWHVMVATAAKLMEAIAAAGGNAVPWRSSGGRGIHLYCVWDEPQDAYSVRQWLTSALSSCGYKNGAKGVAAGEIEVFPKQDHVPIDGFGNQVIVPLAGLSVPLVWDDLAGEWEPGERSDAIGLPWPASAAVPRVARPERVRVDPNLVVGLDELKSLLDAIPNQGKRELDYDEWFRVVCAVHHESEGSADGLALIEAFNARSSKDNPEFFLERVWPHVRSEGRADAVGLGTLKRIAGGFGWHEPLSDEAFEVIEDARPPTPAGMWNEPDQYDGAMLAQDLANPDSTLVASMQLAARVKRKGIPEAQHLCTDLANAERLKESFGAMVFTVARSWFAWQGTHWAMDESDVYRYGARLSQLIREEIKPFAKQIARLIATDAVANKPEIDDLSAMVKALQKWGTQSEMKVKIDAAVGLAAKMLTLDSDLLDRDPMLVNFKNGTVDLRTGQMRKHDPNDFITRVVPIDYKPEAVCPLWVKTLAQITRDPAIAAFLRRWFGYCMTGLTREQVFVTHWGGGSNGKSLILDFIAACMGSYAGTAAPGLLLGGNHKAAQHTTGIAMLKGLRMVTAHESGDGVVLDEAFIKQATGGDKITARFMNKDNITFAPTHKLQLLTNHLPQVKGTDAGIWRRVVLVPYAVSFGTAEEVARGERTHVADPNLLERLRDEIEGVVAWLVAGAVEWYGAGLGIPESVRAASGEYRDTQDRAAQFVREMCEIGFEFEETLGAYGLDSRQGLFPTYESWCKSGNIRPVSRNRFVDEILRVVKGSARFEKHMPNGTGGRKKLLFISGLRLASPDE